MTTCLAKTMRKKERGMALLLTLFALLLLSAVGLFMVMSSNTETRIDANYGSSLRAYYAARSGVEEVRERIKYPASSPGGLADNLPRDIAGNKGGVLYLLNPAAGETVDPTDPTSLYFDDQLCHAYNSGTPKDIKCTTVPTTGGWQLGPQISSSGNLGQFGFKWVRINMKTNRAAEPYFVDQVGSSATLDTRVCWDGQAEQLSPGSTCDANGMQTVYMLTSLAVSGGATGPNGARKLLEAEVVAPSIRPAGAVTATSLTMPTSGSPAGIPPLAVDGRVHKLDGSLPVNPDGSLATIKGCSPVAALATDNGSTQLEQALNQIRLNIVTMANSSCHQDGTPTSTCTPGLWWVRGSGSNPRFFTPTSTSGTNTSGSNISGSNTSGQDGGGSDDNHTLTSAAISYTSLDLSAPQLYGLPAGSTALFAPFIGNPGNQSDSAIYQPGANQTVTNQIAAVNNLVSTSQSQPNYYAVSSAALANSSYGTATTPAVVVVTDPTLSLNGASLSGYGVLVVPNALEITNAATLNWNGIVLINSATGHVTIDSTTKGFINGALLLTPGATFNFPSGNANPSVAQPFQIRYSCEAIDLPFSTLPLKVISTAETSN